MQLLKTDKNQKRTSLPTSPHPQPFSQGVKEKSYSLSLWEKVGQRAYTRLHRKIFFVFECPAPRSLAHVMRCPGKCFWLPRSESFEIGVKKDDASGYDGR